VIAAVKSAVPRDSKESRRKPRLKDHETWPKKKRRAWMLENFNFSTSPVLNTPQKVYRAVEFLEGYWDLYSIDGSFGKTNLIEHHIYTENVPPIKTLHRPINPGLEKDLKEQLDKWIQHDVIEPSSSPWSFAMVTASKKGGVIRWCIDYRLLNKVTLNDSILLPGIEDNLARLSGSSVFSGVDGAGAYHCVGVHKADIPKTAFSTPFGLWQFKRLPFGLCNAPATYTRLVQMVLEGISYDEALPFLDDTCIHSKDLEGHHLAMRKVFEAYRRAGLKIQPSKCHLFQAKIEYLGHFISKDGVSPVPKYVQVVQNWPLPTNKTEARSFLGKVGYYCRFINDYAAIAKPWTDFVGKDENREIKKAPVVARPIMVVSYRHLKQALLTSPVLAFPQCDYKEPFILDTDWSGDANTIGGVLSQRQAGREKVIADGAQKLSRSQQNYVPTKGEL
jgi:hypothetical protein